LSVGKWLSVGVGIVVTLLTALFISLDSTPTVSFLGTGPLMQFAIAGIFGGLVGLAHYMVISRFNSELRRLMNHVSILARADSRELPVPPGMGLAPLAQVIEQSMSSLRERCQTLVAKRRELEIQLRIAEAERRHTEAVLNSITDAVLVTDAFNELALANNAAATVLGFDTSYSLRRPIDQVIDDRSLVKLIKDTLEGVPAAPGHRRHVEHRLQRDGREHVYDIKVAGIGSGRSNGRGAGTDGNDSVGVVTVIRDVTREREIAEMKSDIVSSVSHELRTPLSSIKAYIEMLIDGEAQDEQARAEFYNIIQGETNRLSRLIDNSLNISRIEAGVVRVQREQVSIPSLVRDAVDVMQPQARARNIELKDASSPVYFQVFADKDMIYQATLNLLGNAVKYTPSGGKVTISIEVDEIDRKVYVRVADNGVGIPADDLPHLFEKFYRVDQHKRLAQGTGLGLNLVKQIIETVHGGKVSVVSEPGIGSTFTYSLPLADNS